MNWTSNLRRWTMRSIHAGILGATLLGSASVVCAQPTSSSVINKAANAYYTRSQSFDLPVQILPADRAQLAEIHLYVRTPTSTWMLHEKGTSELKKFNIRVNQDGEYWYSLVTVGKNKTKTPSDLNMENPDQRVIVDTTAPIIQVKAGTTPDGDYCLNCTIIDANPDYASLKAVCKMAGQEIALDPVPNQPGAFRVKNGELMQYPVVVSAMDLAKNVGMKEVNVRDLIATTLLNTGAKTGVQPVVGIEPKGSSELPPPRHELPPLDKTVTTKPGGGLPNTLTFPPNGSNPQGPALGSGSNQGSKTTDANGVPYQLINTTHASVEYRIDQVGPSGVGRVEIYHTPDNGNNWHRLTDEVAKNSPASINLPGDGVYGIRIVVTNGNGFGGKAPVRGDVPHCTIEVDTTSPFVQLRSADVLASTGHVELRWTATDKNLGNEPVSLFYRTKAEGPWQVIAQNVKNDGVHRWAFPRDAGGQFFFKVEVADRAGNVSQDMSRQAILIDTSEPRPTVVGITGSGVRP